MASFNRKKTQREKKYGAGYFILTLCALYSFLFTFASLRVPSRLKLELPVIQPANLKYTSLSGKITGNGKK